MNKFLALLIPASMFASAAFAQEVPLEWTCNPEFYGTADGCDCGCAVVDPDCPVPAEIEECINQCENGSVVAPDTVTCVPNVCGDSSVGADEVCDDGNVTSDDGCSADCLVQEMGFVCEFGGGPCTEIPAGWLCSPDYAADDECDCGCGAIDPACDAGCSDACCADPNANGELPFGCEYNWQPNEAGDGEEECGGVGEGEGEEGEGEEGEGEEGEGEEGEGEEGEGEEGEGEDPPPAGGEGEGETGGGCSSDRRAADGAPFALVGIAAALLVSRRRR